ncbi:hypothetical protein [Propionibacterium ruminifibrarum]|nr:hypothetical protein [Propionibacterium ruminifibrarum]
MSEMTEAGEQPGAPAPLPRELELVRALVVLPDRGVDKLMPVIEVLVQEKLDVVAVELGDEDLSALFPLYAFRACLGVAGITGAGDARRAVELGAAFALCPDPDDETLDVLRAGGIPVICEALTPGEVRAAWRRGVAAVEVRPADVMGDRYPKALPPMVPGVRLIASAQDVPTGRTWLNQGAVAIDVTDPVLSRVFVSGDHASLRKRAADAVRQVSRRH